MAQFVHRDFELREPDPLSCLGVDEGFDVQASV